MAKRKTSVYCLLLLALLLLSGAVLSVGETQARYVSTVVWNTYVEPAAEGTAQQFFTADESLTVVLGQMDTLDEKNNAWYMVDFSVPGDPGTTGSLTWTQILDEGQEPDLEVGMLLDEEVLDQEYPLTIGEDVPPVVTMVLHNTVRRQEDKTVSVRVTWTRIPGEGEAEQAPQVMTAVFQVILPAEEAVEEPTEEPTVEEPATEAPTADPTEESTEDPSEDPSEEPTEEPSQLTRVAPGDPTEETAEEPTEEETTVPPTSDPAEETTEAPTEQVTEETTAPDEEEPTDPEETTEPEPPTLPTQQIGMEALSWFDPEQPLPLWITVDRQTEVELGFAHYYDPTAEPEMWPLPRYTRLSQDGGKTWLLMYQENTLRLELEAGTTGLLMDLSRAELDVDIQRTLVAEGWSETTAPGAVSVGVTPMEEPYVTGSRIMTAQTPLKLTLTEHWPTGTADAPTDYTLTYTVERLTVTGSAEEGYRKAYEPVTLLTAEAAEEETELPTGPALIAEQKGQDLILRPGSTLPPPGTYRINMEWKYKDICIASDQIAFYINYMSNTDSAQTGGAEQ